MAIRSKEEILESLGKLFVDNDSDEVLSLIEDATDTLSSLESDGEEDWKAKYAELDTTWRKKYKDRFFETPDNGQTNPGQVKNENEEDLKSEGEVKTYEELFKEKEDNSGY